MVAVPFVFGNGAVIASVFEVSTVCIEFIKLSFLCLSCPSSAMVRAINFPPVPLPRTTTSYLSAASIPSPLGSGGQVAAGPLAFSVCSLQVRVQQRVVLHPNHVRFGNAGDVTRCALCSGHYLGTRTIGWCLMSKGKEAPL